MNLGKFIVRCLIIWLLGIGTVLASIGIGRSYSVAGIAGPIISLHLMIGFDMAIAAVIFHGLGIPQGLRTVAALTGVVAAMFVGALCAGQMRNFPLSEPYAWVMILAFTFIFVLIVAVRVGPDSLSKA